MADTRPGRARPRRCESAGASSIQAWLFVGGQGAVEEEELQRHDISCILSCCERIVLPPWTTNHLANMRDSAEEKLEPFLQDSLCFLREAKAAQQKCLVACHAGSSRSVSLVLAYLVVEEGMSLHDAWDLVRRLRSGAQPNRNFALQLIDLDRAVHGVTCVTLADLGFDEEEPFATTPPSEA
ncbi:Dual specificity protein phosphatase PHS1 [Symbiodinium microadriaticum]|uniref:protein-tyrosine-phosphatase n=1 Tax=Symbiodinium microadriaticum TaxID=2951 RepID=A0A1Q9CHB4_SYMMI|nr:Dual specificity protein phosphatase PHS1 [Symbiodinium microadriaticum]